MKMKLKHRMMIVDIKVWLKYLPFKVNSKIKHWIARTLMKTCKQCFYFEDGHHCMVGKSINRRAGWIVSSDCYCNEFQRRG